ncbi:solute carrier family 52, riboflavin transporter, member 3-B [Ciona intestinalis]
MEGSWWNSSKTLMQILVLIFGAGAWIAVNGVWVELPAIVALAPEQWQLPSYLTIISQIGNLGPLIVTLMQAMCSKYFNQNAMIYSIVSIGTLSCLLLCFFWNHTAVIAGKEYSVALFALWYALAFVDCTSSVTFLPFMNRFQSMFLTTYFIGEGLSGFMPSIFALAQGVGNTQCLNVSSYNETTNTTTYHIQTHYESPRFSESVFFALLCIMMALCGIAFFLLNHTKVANHFRTEEQTYKQGSIVDSSEYPTASQIINDTYDSLEMVDSDSSGRNRSEYQQQTSFQKETNEPNVDASDAALMAEEQPTLTQYDYVYFLVIIFIINSLSNGVLPSVSSYTSLPYGELAYHLAATLGNMANPVACLIAMFFPMTSRLLLGILATCACGFGSYLMVLAKGSPCPILINEPSGAVLMVLSQILFVGLVSYIKVSIAQVFRLRGSLKSLVWYGAAIQAGSMTGALLIFPFVNVPHLMSFVSGDPCLTVCA